MLTWHAILASTPLWGLIVGLVTPLLTSVAQQPGFTPLERRAVSIVCSVVLGLVTLLANGGLANGPVDAATLVAVIGAAEVAYQQLWKPIGLARVLERWTSAPAVRPAAPAAEAAPAPVEPAAEVVEAKPARKATAPRKAAPRKTAAKPAARKPAAARKAAPRKTAAAAAKPAGE